MLESQGLDMWVFAARCALGSALGSEEGRALEGETEALLRERGVKNLPRWRRMLMPGFGA